MSTSAGGPPVATAKSADATAVVHRWGFGGTSVTTGGLRLISNPGRPSIENAFHFKIEANYLKSLILLTKSDLLLEFSFETKC